MAGVGSTLLVPELLTKPLRENADGELEELGALLGRLDLRPVDAATALLATPPWEPRVDCGRPMPSISLPRLAPARTVSSQTT